MLKVVYGSLTAAARDLDGTVEGVSACSLDGVNVSALGPVASAWQSCAEAWAEGIEALTSTQRNLADALRQVADSYRDSDLDASRTIGRVLR